MPKPAAPAGNPAQAPDTPPAASTPAPKVAAMLAAAAAANMPAARLAAMQQAAAAALPPSLVAKASSAHVPLVPAHMQGKLYRLATGATPQPRTHNAVWWQACAALCASGPQSAAALAGATQACQPPSPNGGMHSVAAYVKRGWLLPA